MRRHLSYANVMATVAVFVALGGASYAAVTLPRNSVGNSQIKKNAVTGSRVKNSSLTGADVRNSSLKGVDVRNSSLTGIDVRNGTLTGNDVRDGSLSTTDFGDTLPPGPQGPRGGQGAKGEQGAAGSPGVPGPTYAEVEDREDPPATPDGLLVEPDPTTITLPTTGRLLVMFTSESVRLFCTTGISSLGLYVDGTPVPNTLREFPEGVEARTVSVFGVTAAAVPAGTHTLTVGRDCPTGNPAGSQMSQNNTLGAVLLGE